MAVFLEEQFVRSSASSLEAVVTSRQLRRIWSTELVLENADEPGLELGLPGKVGLLQCGEHRLGHCIVGPRGGVAQLQQRGKARSGAGAEPVRQSWASSSCAQCKDGANPADCVLAAPGVPLWGRQPVSTFRDFCS